MIDEVSGAAAWVKFFLIRKEKNNCILNRFSSVGPCFTANLNIDYIKPLLTPTWVLVRAHTDRQEGRKVYVHASVENGEGGVYAKAVVLFVQPKKPVQDSIQQNNH